MTLHKERKTPRHDAHRGLTSEVPRRAEDSDARATHRASLAIGWQIMVASAFLVLGIIALALVFVFHQGLPREAIERDPAGVSRVYVDTSDVVQALILIGVGAVGFAGVVSWIIGRRAVKPLGDALRLQREFVADASHELRTPLAVLDARIQLLQRRLHSATPPSAAHVGGMIAELRTDSRNLVDIVNDLLLTASGTGPASEPVTAAPIIEGAVDSLRLLAAERGITVESDLDPAADVRIPEAGLRRCIIALLDNAIAHSPDNSTVTVTAHPVRENLRIVVTDEGHGITGIAPEKIFDRFSHSGSPTATRPGFGIGLALVREIATRQNGHVRVQKTSPAGTVMQLELPLARSARPGSDSPSILRRRDRT